MARNTARPDPQGLRPPPPRVPPTAIATGGPDDDAPIYFNAKRVMSGYVDSELRRLDQEAAFVETMAALVGPSLLHRFPGLVPILRRHKERLESQLAAISAASGHTDYEALGAWEEAKIDSLNTKIKRLARIIAEADETGPEANGTLPQ